MLAVLVVLLVGNLALVATWGPGLGWSAPVVAIGVPFIVYAALLEWKGRIEVDATGVHRVAVVRRRTYPWQDVVEIRTGRRQKGMLHAELVRNRGDVVELRNSGQHVDELRRWHAQASTG